MSHIKHDNGALSVALPGLKCEVEPDVKLTIQFTNADGLTFAVTWGDGLLQETKQTRLLPPPQKEVT